MRGAISRAGFAIALAVVVLVSGGSAGSSPTGLHVHVLTLGVAETAVSGDALPVAQASLRAVATWCGTASQTDLTPNAVAGYPIRWIYAIPSDGPDRLAELASVMQTDAEGIDAWWRSQDPTRVPRNDIAQFPCGLQLDVSTIRMQQSGAQLASPDTRFGAIFNSLLAAGFRSERTKYMVYYDGPVSNDRICGQGGSDRSGFGLAVVYAQACSPVPTAAVAAHELLHAFGAVPSGAPNECPEPNDAHTCDDPRDLMHPFVDESPLSAKILDPGRDDYYGHSGAWPDSRDVPWLVQIDRQVPLTLTISGPGGVEADVPGLQCAQSCTTTWNGDTRLSLTATPGAGAKLVRWGGACAGTVACDVTVGQGGAVSALFAPLLYRLTIAVIGRGTVRSARSGLACRPRCSAAFPSHAPLRLSAAPAKGWRFRFWRGACRGTRPVCTVPMTKATNARAVFVQARR